MRSRQLDGLTVAARVFVLVAMAAPVLWENDLGAVLGLVVLGAISATAQVESWRWGARHFSTTVEGALVGLVCGLTLGSSLGLLAGLTVPPFVAGLHRGLTGVGLAVSAQLTTLMVVAVVFSGGLSPDQSLSVLTWTIAGLGVGCVATFVRSTLLDEPDPVAPYLYAQSLIRQLIDISDGLSSGLDVNSLGGAILSQVRDQLPAEVLALYVPRGETLVPLITRATEPQGSFAHAERIAIEAWAGSGTVVDGGSFAFPLGDTAVVAGTLSDRVDVDLLADVEVVVLSLEDATVQFDTALLFADFRASASADERRRLAREMHDGVAQDIASLGYLVDTLAARPASPVQAEQLTVLRTRITAIVAEVRQSVLTLRTVVGESESLGAAVGSVARHLSEVSGVPIAVTLDEHTTRLPPQVEAELFRIAQEAMNNAVKHAQATAIDVVCQVYAPQALITVSDDGRGLQAARSDSHGMKIMRERAELVDGVLTITENPTGGISVSVQVGADRGPAEKVEA